MNHNSNIYALHRHCAKQQFMLCPSAFLTAHFSGIGGFDLAAQWMGWNNIFSSGKKTSGAERCWLKTFKNKTIADIKDFTGYEYTNQLTLFRADSPANHSPLPGSKGKDDDRYLWEEMLRIIATIKPTYVVGKTLLASSARHSTRCYLTWKHRTTPETFIIQNAVKRLHQEEMGLDCGLRQQHQTAR